MEQFAKTDEVQQMPSGAWVEGLPDDVRAVAWYAGATILPGLVQTDEWRVASLRQWNVQSGREPLSEAASLQTAEVRSSYLNRALEAGASIDVVVDELVIALPLFDASVMAGQIRYLRRLAAQEPGHVGLVVLPTLSDMSRRVAAAHCGTENYIIVERDVAPGYVYLNDGVNRIEQGHTLHDNALIAHRANLASALDQEDASALLLEYENRWDSLN